VGLFLFTLIFSGGITMKAHIYVDVSGGMIDHGGAKALVDQLADHLRKYADQVSLFEFDMDVRPYPSGGGGGGTSFTAVMRHAENAKADVVYVVTDGYGEEIKPADPKSWSWFLYNNKWFIAPPGSTTYQFDNAGRIHPAVPR
jgi:predicted metal-dependent peptidase